jgi:hypothetical protein
MNVGWLLPERAEAGWPQVREAWLRPQRNHRPTPWAGLFGRASARTRPLARPSPFGTVADGGAFEAFEQLPVVMWLDAERYVVLPPIGVSTPQSHTVGAYTWRYAGQAVYEAEAEGLGAAWRDPPLGVVQRPLADSTAPNVLPGLVRVDRMGRVWVLDEVDSPGLANFLRGYDAEGGEPAEQPTAGVVWPILGGEPAFVQPQGWEYTYCDDFENEVLWAWEPTVTNNTADPLESDPDAADNLRGRRSVEVLNDSTPRKESAWGGFSGHGVGSQGSGSVVGERFVLTAHHVVEGEDVGQMYVGLAGVSFRYDLPVEAVVVHGGDGTDPVDGGDQDWAVLELGEDIGVSPFFLSRRAASLVNFGTHLRGFPGVEVDTTTPCANADGDGDQFSASGSVEGVGVFEELLTEVSSAEGMSGAAYYYCWTGDCDDGSAQTAILKGFTGFHTFGPLVSPIRDTILANVS